MLQIEDSSNIKGSVKISGSKNGALPLIVSSLLTKGRVTLKNIPDILDVNVLLKIIKRLNVKYTFNGNVLRIDSSKIKYKDLIIEDVKKIRASSYLMSVMLVLFNKCRISYPGGCSLGKRNLDYHFNAFRCMGYKIKEEGIIDLEKDNNHYQDISFLNKSVGATINSIILAGSLNKIVKIYNYSNEPEVINTIRFLRKIGYSIYEFKDYLLVTHKRNIMHKIIFKNSYDRIEGISYIILGLLSDKLKIKNVNTKEIKEVLKVLKQMSCNIKVKRNIIYTKKSKMKPYNLISAPYPLFPTDAQPLIASLMLNIDGMSTIKDLVYKDRFNYSVGLKALNGNVYKKDNILYINKSNLIGNVVKGYDLRGVFSLILAGIKAKGITTILDGDIAFRGYENLIDKLTKIGVKISYIKE